VNRLVENYLAMCKFNNVSDQFEWPLTSVYSPSSDVDRQLL
jgi:hypothetical protein